VLPFGERAGRRHPRLLGVGRQREEEEQVRHEQRVFVHAGDARQHRLERRLPLAEHRDPQREVAQRDVAPRRAAGDRHVAAVERGEAERAEQRAEQRALPREPAIFDQELREQRAEAAQHQRAEVVELHLFHVRVAGEDPLEVVEPAAFRRAPRPEAKRLARHPRLGDERGDRGDHDQHRRPPRDRPEQHRERRQRDQVLEDADQRHREAQRPVRRLAPGVLHHVVGLRVFEVLELERQRLLEDLFVDDVAEVHAQQLAGEAGEPPDRQHRDGEPELPRDVGEHQAPIGLEAYPSMGWP
jgi:hypothetical protein